MDSCRPWAFGHRGRGYRSQHPTDRALRNTTTLRWPNPKVIQLLLQQRHQVTVDPDGPPPSGLPSADCSCGWGDVATMIDSVLDSVAHHLTEVGYV